MKDSYTRSQDDFFKRFLDGIKYYVLFSIVLGIIALVLGALIYLMIQNGYRTYNYAHALCIALALIGVLVSGGILFFVMFALGEICVSLSDIKKTLSMNSAESQEGRKTKKTEDDEDNEDEDDEDDEDNEDEEEESSVSSSGKVKITAHTLNVRQGASRSSGVLGTLSEGEVVAYSKVKNGWLQISFRGEEGWIMQEFTQKM